MKGALANRPYFRRLLVTSLLVLIPSLLLARGSVVRALAIPWFILDERLGYYQMIPESWVYGAALDSATVVALLIAARWKSVSLVVAIIFLINILLAMYFVAVYDPKA